MSMISAQCAACHATNRLPLAAAGKKARCASCGEVFRVPKSASPPIESKTRPSPGLLAELEALEAAATPITDTTTRCPKCGRPAQGGSSICIPCGISLASGKRIKTRVERSRPDAGKVTYTKEQSGSKRALILILGIMLTLSSVSCLGQLLRTGVADLALDEGEFPMLLALGYLITFSTICAGVALIWISRQKTLDMRKKSIRTANIVGGAPFLISAAVVLVAGIVMFGDGKIPRDKLPGFAFIWVFTLLAGGKMVLSGIRGRVVDPDDE